MASREELLANPASANAAAEAAVLAASKVDKPEVPDPPSDLVVLPGGLVKNGEVYRHVRVRELDGNAEEALARALQPRPGTDEINWAHFLTVLLEWGTAQIGDFDENRTKELLKDMLVGDRDAIVMGIRQATYGDEVDLPNWVCPACLSAQPISFSLAEEVKSSTLDDPREQIQFEVKLRKGRVATVRLVTGRDEMSIYEMGGLLDAERESIMLQKCLVKIVDANGQETVVAGFSKSIVMSLSIPDRKAIVRELNKRQPGPRYNEITFVHQGCQKEVPLVVGLGNLFPDLF